MSDSFDVIVIGGGPAGMMAAATAAKRGRSVLLLEKNPTLGKKLSITGGGRCNVTNNKPNVRSLVASYKDAGKFLFSTFTQHGVKETIDWFAALGVPFVEENEGRLFPHTHSAETIKDTLIAALVTHGVTVRTKTAVQRIEHDAVSGVFTITAGKSVFSTKACIVATGGTSRPETGSTGEGFTWLQNLGHSVVSNSFALVPISIKEKWVARISGVTLPEVKISLYADGKKERSVQGKILFTHTGLSGPTILNLSSTIGELLTHSTVTVTLDLIPGLDAGTLRTHLNTLLQEHSNKKIQNILPELLPRALATIILEELALDGETPGHSVRTADRTRLVTYLKRMPLTVKGLLGAEKAVISGGGVTLTEIDFKTMQSRLVPGLYLVGDVLNIDRPSGGYSLQLCWSTGFVAGNHA